MKGIIFDLDGVLVHTDHYHYLAWKKISEKLNIEFNEKDNERLRGIGRMESLDVLLEKYNGPELSIAEKKQLAEEKNIYYCEYVSKMNCEDVLEVTRKTLSSLKNNGFLIALGSSSKNAKLILKKTKLYDSFDAISDGTMITRSKPDPEVFLKAAELLKVQPKDCFVVEDALSGIQAAKHAGMIPIGIGNSLKQNDCFYLIQSLDELQTVIKCK